MSWIIRLQNLPWSANSMDIRNFFQGLSIPEGGVHIVGGEQGDAFIAFSTDEDARQAMANDGGKIKEVKIKLLLSSRSEMQKVIEQARQTSLNYQNIVAQSAGPTVNTVANAQPAVAQQMAMMAQMGLANPQLMGQQNPLGLAQPNQNIPSQGLLQNQQLPYQNGSQKAPDATTQSQSGQANMSQTSIGQNLQMGAMGISQQHGAMGMPGLMPGIPPNALGMMSMIPGLPAQFAQLAQMGLLGPNMTMANLFAAQQAQQKPGVPGATHSMSGAPPGMPGAPSGIPSTPSGMPVAPSGMSGAPSGMPGAPHNVANDSSQQQLQSGQSSSNVHPVFGTSVPQMPLHNQFPGMTPTIPNQAPPTLPNQAPPTMPNQAPPMPNQAPSNSTLHPLNSTLQQPTNSSGLQTPAPPKITPHEREKQIKPSTMKKGDEDDDVRIVSEDKDIYGRSRTTRSRSRSRERRRSDRDRRDRRRRSRSRSRDRRRRERSRSRDRRDKDRKSRKSRSRSRDRKRDSDKYGGSKEATAPITSASPKVGEMPATAPITLASPKVEIPNKTFQVLTPNLQLGPSLNQPHVPFSNIDTKLDINSIKSPQFNKIVPEPNSCVEFRNAPLNVRYSDIRGFCQGYSIDRDGIKLINDKQGRRTGIIYVQFVKSEIRDRALRHLNGKRFFESVIEVLPLTDEMFNKAVDSYKPPRSTSQESQQNQPPPIVIFKIMSLPNDVTRDEIAQIFDMDLETIRVNREDPSKVIAYVKIKNEPDAQIFISVKKQHAVRNKPVLVVPCFEEEFVNAVKKFPDEPDPIKTECILIKNLPRQATDRDVCDFFSEIGLVPLTIHMMFTAEGEPSGDVFCEFRTPEEANKAATKNESIFGRNIVSVILVTRQTVNEALGSPVPCSPNKNNPGKPALLGQPPPMNPMFMPPHMNGGGSGLLGPIPPLLGPSPFEMGPMGMRPDDELRERSQNNGENSDPRKGRGQEEREDDDHPEQGPQDERDQGMRPVEGWDQRMGPPHDRWDDRMGPHRGMGIHRGMGHPDRYMGPRHFDDRYGRYPGPPGRGRGGFRGRGGYDYDYYGGPYRGGRGGAMRGGRPTHYSEQNRGEDDDDDMLSPEEFGRLGCVLALENVPYKATMDDILAFFKDFELTKKDIIRRYDEQGRATGDARVCLVNPDEAKKAYTQLNRKTILDRVIYVSPAK